MSGKIRNDGSDEWQTMQQSNSNTKNTRNNQWTTDDISNEINQKQITNGMADETKHRLIDPIQNENPT